MIDTNELRRLAQAANAAPDGVSLNWVKLLQDFQKEANPAVINELLDRLEAAESDALEQARLNGMGASREAALMAKLAAAETAWKVSEKSCHDLTEKVIPNLRDQLEAAEKSDAESIAMYRKARDERDALRTELADLRSSMTFRTSLIGRIEAERDALRARVEAMERQEPVAWCATDETGTVIESLGMNQSRRFDTALYLAPGAKGNRK